jgi:glucose-6-phosphate 1-dehydrogenase
MIEKPFGHDLDTARELQRQLREVLEEEQILRVDHFLGKEPVMDLTYLRFANLILEPVWNRYQVSHVQMTMAEDFGVEDRGAFYDEVGTLRDVVQNHLLQVLALTAMEPPAGNQPDSIRDKKLDLLKAIRPADPDKAVRGQYEGFREIKGVRPESDTETYVALQLEIDNWRWSGVPFFIRAGKCLPVKETEVNVVFQRPPPLGVGSGRMPDPNQLIVRIDPLPGALLRMLSKRAGEEAFDNSDLEVLFEKSPGEDPTPYERLLADALSGRQELFMREDMVEESWRIVQPLLEHPPPVETYAKARIAPRTWCAASASGTSRGYREQAVRRAEELLRAGRDPDRLLAAGRLVLRQPGPLPRPAADEADPRLVQHRGVRARRHPARARREERRRAAHAARLHPGRREDPARRLAGR